MRTLLGRSGLLALLIGGIVLGCHKPMVQQKQPPDPLLISKKPIEGKETPGDPVLVPRIDPQQPPLPRHEPGASPEWTASNPPRR